MMIRKRAIIYAMSINGPIEASKYCCRPSHHSASSAAFSFPSPSLNDDLTFKAKEDYFWLKASRPILIKAEQIPRTDRVKSLKESLSHNTKIVHFQRHGQGRHNEIYAQWTQSTGIPLDLSEKDPSKNPLLLPSVIDAPLTEKGVYQCEEQYRTNASNLHGVEAIIVSPLVRALQTAQITFKDHLPGKNSKRYSTIRDRVTPWIAHEGCREELGLLLCNKRRPLRQTQLDFPHVNFSHLPNAPEDDPMWTNYSGSLANDEHSGRESVETISCRVYDFLVSFVRTLPEREIAVVGHSAWLHAMCHAVLDHDSDGEFLGKGIDTTMFGQAEMRTMKLTFK